MNDSELVQRLREQDPEAVRHLSDTFLPSFWRFVYFRVNGDAHTAEDIVSEAMLALVKSAETDTTIENPRAWLRKVASHKILDHFRAAKRVQHLVEAVGHTVESADHNDAVRQHQAHERRAEVRQVMDELPDQHREALEWKYIERLSVKEIAERLDVTEKAAESILFRARRTFRDKLLSSAAADDAEPEGGRGGGAVKKAASNGTAHAPLPVHPPAPRLVQET